MSSDKQFPPTAKRRQKARDDGDIVRSKELSGAAGFIALTLYIYSGFRLLPSPAEWIATTFGPPEDFLTNNVLLSLDRALYMLREVVVPSLLFLCGGVLLIEVVQVGFHLSPKPVSFQWSRLNPVQGLKRMFGSASNSDGTPLAPVAELLKMQLFSLCICGAWIGALLIDIDRIAGELLGADSAGIGAEGAREGMERAGVLLGAAATNGSIAAFICGVVHLFIVYRRREHRLRMTRDELRRELRESEGDPEMKMLRKQLHEELLTHDLIEGVRSAKVVIVHDG